MERKLTELAESILACVAEELGYEVEQLSLDDALNTDLGAEGEDVVEFLQVFCKRFGVDALSQSKLARYFESSTPVTIRDLVHTVDQRAWGQI
jgi:hypothetical protein